MKIQLLLLSLLASVFAYAQTNDPRIANTKTALDAVEQITLPDLNNDVLRERESQRRTAFPDAAPRFAEAVETNVNPENSGTWEVLPNGNALWRLRIFSEGAYSLNLGFSQYFMPKGGSLVLYSPDYKTILGPFTVSDNEEHEQLWTPILPGDEMVLEVQVPASKRSELRLQLKNVNHDFMDFFAPSSGACHLDAICGAANGWEILDRYRDAIQSVAVYGFNGNTFCTGFLVNNTQNDCTPYFMTANHCGVTPENAPSMVVYWNYQNSTCREPRSPGSGALGDGPLDNFSMGAIFRANYALTDMTLLELDDEINDTTNVFFAGWTLEEKAPTDTVVLVHHPGAEEKRVSLEYDGTVVGAWGSGAVAVEDGNYLIISGWDVGSSEGGSSGAPLFDSNQRVVGQLRGGSAFCNVDGFDAFGWFRYSWLGNGTPESSLQSWLDPANSGIINMDGRRQAGCNVTLAATTPFQEICAPNEVVYEVVVSDSFLAPVQLALEGLPNGVTASFSQNPATPGSTVTVSITNTSAFAEGRYFLKLQATDGTQATNIALGLLVSNGATPAITLNAPENADTDVSLLPDFAWASSSDVATYQIQIATDSLFTNIVQDLSGLTDTLTYETLLEALTTYFWRVRGKNGCGEGNWSAVQRFTTADIICTTVTATDLPKDIFDLQANVVTSSVELNLPGTILEVKVKGLDISHSWVGDLQVSLSSPGGKSVRLFDRPGVPNDLFGCDGRNVQASFDDEADNTAAKLEITCNENPGIEGSYQPLDPFALLAGEPAIGVWTLSVEDFVPEDGGSLDAWSLEVCAARTKVASVFPDANTYSVCANQGLEFDIYLGEGFTNNINLSAEGQPTGALVSFSKNPAAPGDTVKVTLSNLSGAGNFNLIISASDDKDTATTTVQLAVSDVQQNFVAIFPFDDATNIPVSTSVEWGAVTGADSYIITVYKVPGMLLLTDTVTTTSYFLNNLELSATYEWQIQTNTDCGLGTSELFSFSTIPNLSFSVTPFSVNACPTDKPSFNINIGAGYGSPASVTYTVVPEATLPLTFSSNPNNVPVGTTIKATLDNLGSLSPNQYTITFRITDGTYSSEDDAAFRLRGVPAVPLLQGPVDGNSSVEQSPVLTWKSSADATSYRVEVATDDRFTNIVRNAVVTDTVYTTNPSLGGGAFYWRVTSLNDCGFSTSGIFDFFIQAAGVHEWQGQQVTFFPNPTSGQVNIVFAQAITGDVNAEIFAANGQLLKRVAINASVLSHSLDLSDHPNGLYLIRLINGDAALTERILVQK